MKYLAQIIIAAILILFGKYFVGESLKPEFIGGGLIAFVTIIIGLIFDTYENRKRIILILRCKFMSLQKGKYIRFSMSYQYRIKFKDKYLLVKNSNFNHYQLVGGKYKRNKYTAQILSSFEAIDDLKMPTHGLMKDDLVVFVPAKNAIKFIDWFNSKKDREVSHWREFYEELIDVKGRHLPHSVFPYVHYNFVKSVITPLKRTPGWDCWEILQYDVLDLLPTPAQEAELEKLFNQGDSGYIKWADEELIRSLGFDSRQKEKLYEIGPHTKWVVNLKWNKE